MAPRAESSRAGATESNPPGAAGARGSDSVPPGAGVGDARSSEAPSADAEAPEGFLREVFRRVLETGARSLTPENIRQAARELRLPKEVLHHLVTQIEEGKSAFYKAAAQEVRGFLERSNLADEFARALTRLTFEAKLEVRFKPSTSGGRPTPRVGASASIGSAPPEARVKDREWEENE